MNSGSRNPTYALYVYTYVYIKNIYIQCNKRGTIGNFCRTEGFSVKQFLKYSYLNGEDFTQPLNSVVPVDQ